MKIKVIWPSRQRPHLINTVINNWKFKHLKFDGKADFYLSLDRDDPALADYKYYAEKYGISYFVSNNKTAVEAVNIAASYINQSSLPDENYILIVISDDFDCPEHWDTSLLNAIEDKSNFCAKTNDGLQPTLITMPIMDRIYYEHYGYVYNPNYKHMFVDQELTAVAIMTGKYIKLSLTFNHLHYSTGKTKKDALNVRNDATWQYGERLFNERLKINFGIDNPVVPYSSIQWR